MSGRMRLMLILISAAQTITAAQTISACGAADDGCIRKALMLDGAASAHVPGLGAARETALLAVADCPEGVVVSLPEGQIGPIIFT